MTIDNLQQPSGESLRKRAMRLAPEAEEIILPLYTEDIKPRQFLEAVLEAFSKTDATRHDSSWPWGGIATTEDYR